MTIQELEQIIALYGKSIYSFCLQLTRNSDAADDLYQETWLIACRNRKKITYSKNVKSYLLSVAIGIWKNQKRKYAWRNRIAPQEELSENTAGTQPDMGGDALLSYLDRERNQAVQEAVGRLDEKYRIPILLFYLEIDRLPMILLATKCKEDFLYGRTVSKRNCGSFRHSRRNGKKQTKLCQKISGKRLGGVHG